MLRLILVAAAVTCLMCSDVETVSESGAIFEETDVFVGGQDGIFEYRIPVLVTSNEGTLLAFCDARVHKEGDPPNNIDLALKRSFDGGKTWGPLQLLVDAGEGAVADSLWPGRSPNGDDLGILGLRSQGYR